MLEHSMQFTNNLYYKNGDDWTLIPDWSCFFISLGKIIAKSKKKECRNIICISVPTKAYCAAFIALGIIIAKEANQNNSEPNNAAIYSAPYGTVISYLEKDKIKKGVLEGIVDVDGNKWIRIRILQKKDSGVSVTTWTVLPPDRITISHDQDVNLTRRQVGTSVHSLNKLLCQVLGIPRSDEIVMRSKCELAILGQLSDLRHDIAFTLFACKTDSEEFIESNLQELLRVRNFMTNREQPFASEIVKVSGNQKPVFFDSEMPSTIIFDGAVGLTKWRDYCSNADWIVVLDRTESKYQEGVEILNANYLQSHISEDLPKEISAIPQGVEMMIFQDSHK